MNHDASPTVPKVTFEHITDPDFTACCAHCGRKYEARPVVMWLLSPDTRELLGTICPACVSPEVLIAYVGELRAALEEPATVEHMDDVLREGARLELTALSAFLPATRAESAKDPISWLPCVVLPAGAIAYALSGESEIEDDADLDPTIWGEILDPGATQAKTVAPKDLDQDVWSDVEL